MTEILVTGATGLLGPYLVSAASHLGAVTTSARRGGDWACDLRDPGAVRQLVDRVKPTIAFHAAGLTDVDRCEAHPDEAQAANASATENLVDVLPPSCRLIYISTDQVYPDTPGPHREGTEAPVNAYGRSKLDAERAVSTHPRGLVLRTNFFGPSLTPGRESLSDFVVNGLTERRELTMFTDVHFSPLHMSTLAQLLCESATADLIGTYNLASREGTSKYDFAMRIAAYLGLPTATIRPVRASQKPGRAPRPADLRMACDRLEKALGRVFPTLAREVTLL